MKQGATYSMPPSTTPTSMSASANMTSSYISYSTKINNNAKENDNVVCYIY
jgi:hypothetical protein